jgi:ketosteroid isomerase-like protein
MKRILPGLVAALVILAVAGHASARGSAEEVTRGVLAMDDARIKARADADIPTMSRIYADDYQLVTAEGALRTKEDQIGEMRSGQLRFQPVELLERSVRIYGVTAIVFSHERATIIRNGKDIGGEFRANRVYVSRDGRWELVLTQVTRIAP